MTPEGVESPLPKRPAPWRASFAILAGAAMFMAALALGVWFTATRLEDQSRQWQERLISNGLAMHAEDMRRSVSPNVIWDDAVKHLDLKPDAAWAQDNIGKYFWREDGYSLVFVLGADGEPKYAPVIAQLRARELARGRDDPKQTEPSVDIDGDTAARLGSEAHILFAALVQSDHSAHVAASARAPIVVVAEPIDRVFLTKLTRRHMLKGLTVLPAGAPVPKGFLSAPLNDVRGVAVARLAWRPHDSVASLIGVAVPLLAIAILALTLFPVLLIRHERRRVRALTALMADARQASEAKSAFLATMSHEIRTPLNGILGMAQAMERDALPDRQRTRLAVIRSSGQTLLEILNDVLDLSKIEAGKLVLEEVEFDLEAMMQDVRHCFATLAREKGLDFVVDPGEAGGVYRGDPTRVRQVLFNLVSNAMKFTDAGAVQLEAWCDDGKLTLQVSDTGIGIVADKQATIFGKFNQADASTTRRFGGSGLGLSICRDLVELMGGTISVASRPGYGSTFTVTLPLERVGEASEEVADAAARGDAPNLSGLRILAAEDNPTNQLVLKALLSGLGVEPTIAANGEEAVDAWSQGQWDLILMDVQMPVMDGLAAARAIREREAETGRRRTPIVALTADAMSHQEQACLAAGMDGRLTKPIDVAQLFEVVTSLGSRDELAA